MKSITRVKFEANYEDKILSIMMVAGTTQQEFQESESYDGIDFDGMNGFKITVPQ